VETVETPTRYMEARYGMVWHGLLGSFVARYTVNDWCMVPHQQIASISSSVEQHQ